MLLYAFAAVLLIMAALRRGKSRWTLIGAGTVLLIALAISIPSNAASRNQEEIGSLVPDPPATKNDAEIAKICSARPCVLQATMEGKIGELHGAVVQQFIQIAEKAKADGVLLYINSPGGEFDSSAVIFRALHDSQVPVTCVVTGEAASGAFWALEGCQERLALPEARLMTHTPYSIAPKEIVLSKRFLKNQLAQIELLESVMGATICKRMGMPLADMLRRLDQGDWWMSPSQAIENHALDGIVDSLPSIETELKVRYGAKYTKKHK